MNLSEDVFKEDAFKENSNEEIDKKAPIKIYGIPFFFEISFNCVAVTRI